MCLINTLIQNEKQTLNFSDPLKEEFKTFTFFRAIEKNLQF